MKYQRDNLLSLANQANGAGKYIAAETLASAADYIVQLESKLAASTLRDEFAKAAMQAAATNPEGASAYTVAERAEWAYRQADAMMVARCATN